MGSPISPVIANIFMEHFEKEALRKTPKEPKVQMTRLLYGDTAELNSVNSLFSSTINIQISTSHYRYGGKQKTPLHVSKKADGTLDHSVSNDLIFE